MLAAAVSSSVIAYEELAGSRTLRVFGVDYTQLNSEARLDSTTHTRAIGWVRLSSILFLSPTDPSGPVDTGPKDAIKHVPPFRLLLLHHHVAEYPVKGLRNALPVRDIPCCAGNSFVPLDNRTTTMDGLCATKVLWNATTEMQKQQSLIPVVVISSSI